MQIKNNTETVDFDWDFAIAEDLRMKRVPNQNILAKYNANVWRHDAGAEDAFLAYEKMLPESAKEPKTGECRSLVSVVSVNEKEMVVTLSGMVEAVIQLDKEKSFFRNIGMDQESFVNWMKQDGSKDAFVADVNRRATIETVKPFTIASLSKGYSDAIRREFFDQIKTPTNAYMAKIVSRNGGGFLVNVSGVEGFLPGSLAAANVVRDFDSLLGKEVFVMVEDFLKDIGTFVFSHKKYLTYVLPSKIESLSTEEKYTGTITGTAKFGIFVEFNEIFTGLIHTSKMTPAMREEFKENKFKSGEEISFWIKEITADKKIILTDEDPTVRMKEIEAFKEKNLGVITGGEVVSIQPFGALVKLQKDIVGLISQKEIKNKKKKYAVGEKVMVTVERVHNDKIFLAIPNED
jgi:ribosomal protein S1